MGVAVKAARSPFHIAGGAHLVPTAVVHSVGAAGHTHAHVAVYGRVVGVGSRGGAATVDS